MARARRWKLIACAALIVVPLGCIGWCLYPFLPMEEATPPPLVDAATPGEYFAAPVAFSPDSAWFCYLEGNTLVWRSLRDAGERRVSVEELLTDSVTDTPVDSMTFTSDGRLVLARWRGVPVLVSGLPGEKPTMWPKMCEGHGEGVVAVSAAPVGDTLAVVVKYTKEIGKNATAGYEALETVSTRDPALRRVLSEDRANAMRPAKLSRDGRYVTFPDAQDAVIKVWRASDGQLVRTIPAENATEPALSADGERVAFGDRSDSRCCLWSLAEGRELDTWGVPGRIRDITFHPDGTLIVACDHAVLMAQPWKGTLWIKNPATGRRRWVRVLDGAVTAVAVSPDGQWLAACGGKRDQRRARLWRWEQFAP